MPDGARHLPLQGWNVLLCVDDAAEVAFLREWVRDRGGLALHATDWRAALRFVAANGATPIMTVVGAGRPGQSTEIVERCLAFRDAAPNMPIMLLMPDVAGNDFSTERMAICDVTLRIPVSQGVFEDAVLAALANNITYCQRMAPEADTSAAAAALSPRALTRWSAPLDPEQPMTLGWWLMPALLIGVAVCATLVARLLM